MARYIFESNDPYSQIKEKNTVSFESFVSSHVHFSLNLDNAIPIKSWFSDPSDTALLNLLPMLDALR